MRYRDLIRSVVKVGSWAVATLAIACSFVLDEAHANEISRSFELRYFSTDEAANGETDFKGPTEIFDTEQRVAYLEKYADYATGFFSDENLDTQVISEEELTDALALLKPQPLPEVRERILLDEWKWVGYKEGQRKQSLQQLDYWNGKGGVSVQDGALRFSRKASVSHELKEQDWRYFVEFTLGSERAGESALSLKTKSGAVLASATIREGKVEVMHGDGKSIAALDRAVPNTVIRFEVDNESERFNVLVNGDVVCDFERLIRIEALAAFEVAGEKGVALDHVFSQGYAKTEFDPNDNHSLDFPYSIQTLIDESFAPKPVMEGWNTLGYDDDAWGVASLPHPHGGERFKGEALYLRKEFAVGDLERALLTYEALDPAGEIWINGRVVEVKHKRTPGKLDVSKFLQPHRENLIALKIYPNKVKHATRHTATDHHTGWFAGRMHIDLTGDKYITDVFAYASALKGEDAVCRVEVRAMSEDWGLPFHENEEHRLFEGKLRVSLHEWFPQEKEVASAVSVQPVGLNLRRDKEVVFEIPVEDAELWTVERPFLYKVQVELLDERDRVIDDYAVTTGLRTISQDGGVFSINGRPSMMNGAMIFGFRPPLEDIARTVRAGTKEWLTKEILMVKKMNGNTIRMSVHNDQEGGVNDPRLAEIGDQLGIMFQWTTGTWVRKLSPWTLDIESIPLYVKEVRNRPSIVMYQLTNHPNFLGYEEETIPFYSAVYNQIYPLDPSRLIAPTSNVYVAHGPNDRGDLNRQGETIDPHPIWTAPMMTIGDMDHATGYGATWDVLRMYPYPPDFHSNMGWRSSTFKAEYIDSPIRAYFDFESEENAAQANWNNMKGKPYYRYKSYEYTYDIGSIGRQLSEDEWRASQAWQCFSGYEAYRKKRALDYDGMVWCVLNGGGNTGTYMKPLVDYHGYAKLGYYGLQMVFQPLLVGTDNVDVAIGPDDAIEMMALNLGPARDVEVRVEVKTLEGKPVASKSHALRLEGGRSKTVLPDWDVHPGEGFYVLEYSVFKNE